ncbi:MAG: 5-(carboxyamino)imidazole ribonucleotide mutase [Candidatus Latescibacterota bacterium]|nr:MAG: 5-(carboxyamino)imidazole ribonucleotide mutase [Candidatus Latescibacterota bacterium]
MANDTRVAIVMGSTSDEGHLEPAFKLLDLFGLGWEKQILSAHRQPDELRRYIEDADSRGVAVFIAAAGLAAALPGVVAAHTLKPVIGIPVPGGPLKGIDALLSIVQMPGGIPVATVGVGSNGPKNAAVLAARILSLTDESVGKKLQEHRDSMR